MEKREVMLYVITIISFIVFIYIIFGAVSKIPSISDKKFISMTGNVVINLENNYKIGDNLDGELIINSNELNKYGILLLTKDNEPILTETFNLNDIPKNKINSDQYSVKIRDFADYKFEEKGNYELMFSVLDLNINIKKKFVVE
jgi:hypothetical protein